MQIHAAVSIVPVQVILDLPDSAPVVEIRDRVIEQARHLLANNGTEHVVLAASHDELVDGISCLADLGFPVLIEYVMIQPPEPDRSELAEYGCLRSRGRNGDDLYDSDWPD